jgi:hypothetical protein
MNLYAYRAILGKTMFAKGKVTHVDRRSVHSTSTAAQIALDTQCVVGHVLADDEEQAKNNAIVELKALYREEQGYKDHGNVVVRIVSEETVKI